MRQSVVLVIEYDARRDAVRKCRPLSRPLLVLVNVIRRATGDSDSLAITGTFAPPCALIYNAKSPLSAAREQPRRVRQTHQQY